MLEALNVKTSIQGKELVNIVVGRFQPFTLGHGKVLQQLYKENGLPIVVFLVKSGKVDSSNPFSEELQKDMLNSIKEDYNIKDIKVIKYAAIDLIFNELRPEYEPVLWGVGSDRLKNYNGQVNREEYRTDLNVREDFSTFEIVRGDEDISATKVRKSLIEDDFRVFKKMMPIGLWDKFDLLKDNIKVDIIIPFSKFKKNENI